MSKNGLIIILGLWVALVPFLGFPGAWKTSFIVISGFLIAIISVLMIARQRISESREVHRQQQNKPEKAPHDEMLRNESHDTPRDTSQKEDVVTQQTITHNTQL